MPKLSDQLAFPGLDDFTGLTAVQYLDRLISLVTRCASMSPDRYLDELNRLSRMRESGKMTDGQKQGFHALEGLAEIAGMQRERDYGG